MSYWSLAAVEHRPQPRGRGRDRGCWLLATGYWLLGQYVEKSWVYHGRGTSRGTPFTMIHPRLFHIFSLFCHPGPVKRNYLHGRQTQPAPREYYTQYYVVEVHRLVELNRNILVWHVERMGMMQDIAVQYRLLYYTVYHYK